MIGPHVTARRVFPGQAIEIRNRSAILRAHAARPSHNHAVKRRPSEPPAARAWEIARAGDLRGGAEHAREALHASPPPADAVDLHLAIAFCAMRQGQHATALGELDVARGLAVQPGVEARWTLRVDAWRAEVAYFQGRYSDADALVGAILNRLEAEGDAAYAAFALRTRMAVLLARTDYAGIDALAERAIALAEAGGDAYVIVQIHNVLGAASFDRATSKLKAPHARAHLSALDLKDVAPMEADARDALRRFEQARDTALRANYEYAAWYVSGNIERLEIILGNAERAVRAIRKRLRALQKRGATYDEIVTRSNLAWGLRTLGRHREALDELDAALSLVRATGTFNVLLEFLEYDRSIVLDALGDAAGARSSYRRYLQLIGTSTPDAARSRPEPIARRPLEPYYLKRADRLIQEHLHETITMADLARHCGISERMLEKSFADFRGITPVAHVRNLRLENARALLHAGKASVAEAALRCGFRSSTTFALEFRRRYGITPSRARREGGLA